MSIKFGTDGWRAVIADQYTFENLARVSYATARWLKDTYGESPSIVIGHDTRFMGLAFTEYAARVFAHEGVRVIFGDGFTTTPAISWSTRAYGCNAGIVITASHNPPQYNGFKIKADFGGPASPEVIAAVEGLIPESYDPGVTLPEFEEFVVREQIERRDITSDYVDELRRLLDIPAIKASGVRIAHDAMYGAGQGLVSRLVGADSVVELRSEINPGFAGQAPEPIDRNLTELAHVVVEAQCNVGLANDGDADRIGMFDEKGNFVDSHQMMALLVKYLHKEQHLSGDVVKTFSTTHLLDKMGAAYGLRVQTTPIGFKYIGSRIVEGDVLVGGEESGGMAVKGHIPERDGIYIGLLLVEMIVKRGRALSELVQELFDEFGRHVARRSDVHTTEDKKQAVLRRLADGGLQQVGGQAVSELQTMDGFKHVTRNGWLLVRPSGTEPVLRVYAEAESAEAADEMIRDAMQQLGV